MSKARKIAAVAAVGSGLCWFATVLLPHPVVEGLTSPELLVPALLLSLMGILGRILLLGRPQIGRVLLLVRGIGGFSLGPDLAGTLPLVLSRGRFSSLPPHSSLYPDKPRSHYWGKRRRFPGFLEETIQSRNSKSSPGHFRRTFEQRGSRRNGSCWG